MDKSKPKTPNEKVNDFKKYLEDDIKNAIEIDIEKDVMINTYKIETSYNIIAITEYIQTEQIVYSRFNKTKFSAVHDELIETYSETSEKAKQKQGFPNSYYYDIIKKEIDKLKPKEKKK